MIHQEYWMIIEDENWILKNRKSKKVQSSKSLRVKPRLEMIKFSFWIYVYDFQTYSHFDAQNVSISRAKTMCTKCRNLSWWDYVYFFPFIFLHAFYKFKEVWQIDGRTNPFERCFSHQNSFEQSSLPKHRYDNPPPPIDTQAVIRLKMKRVVYDMDI